MDFGAVSTRMYNGIKIIVFRYRWNLSLGTATYCGTPQEQKHKRQTNDCRCQRGWSTWSVGHVAQRSLAARLTRVDLDPFADHDASVLTFVGTAPFQPPKLLTGTGALVALGKRVPFDLKAMKYIINYNIMLPLTVIILW